MIERISENVGRFEVDKKPRLGTAAGEERAMPCESENAREMNGKVCAEEAARECAGKDLDWRSTWLLAAELNFENAARGAR
jgi:hypothetical protein